MATLFRRRAARRGKQRAIIAVAHSIQVSVFSILVRHEPYRELGATSCYRRRHSQSGRGRTFLLEYTYAGQSPEVKQQIVDMAMNASGIRDTARVLRVSPTRVLKELKKRNLSSPR